MTRVDKGWVLRAGSVAPLVKARGFGMTHPKPLLNPFCPETSPSEGVIPKPGALQPGEGSRAGLERRRELLYCSTTVQVCDG
jgi:hypothetical protein